MIDDTFRNSVHITVEYDNGDLTETQIADIQDILHGVSFLSDERCEVKSFINGVNRFVYNCHVDNTSVETVESALMTIFNRYGDSIAKIDASINRTNSIFDKNESTTRYLYDCFATQGIEVSRKETFILTDVLEDAR